MLAVGDLHGVTETLEDAGGGAGHFSFSFASSRKAFRTTAAWDLSPSFTRNGSNSAWSLTFNVNTALRVGSFGFLSAIVG